MSRRPRRNHTSAFKSKVAHSAVRGEKTMSELAQEFDVHPNQIKQRRDQLLEGVAGVIDRENKPPKPEPGVDVKIFTRRSAN